MIPNSVTAIPPFAFDGCSSLVSVTIGSCVTSIGDFAFRDCSSLDSITIPESVTWIGSSAFEGCSRMLQTKNGVQYADKWVVDCDSNISSVILRANTVGIARDAFRGCYRLTEITIPKSVAWIVENPFQRCSQVESITVESGNTRYHVAKNCLIETETKTLISGCKNSEIPADGSITVIGNFAFSGSGIASITIPYRVTSIGRDAFSNCVSLRDITIENGVTAIGIAAFYCCTNLQGISIPQSVESIGNSAFAGNDNLTYILVDEENAVYHSDGNCLIETETGTLLSGCKNSVIPAAGVTSIGSNAFYHCQITEITIPESVTNIGNYAFDGCENLTRIIFDGTKEEWNAISKGYDWDYDTGEYIVHCSDGTLLNKEGNVIEDNQNI